MAGCVFFIQTDIVSIILAALHLRTKLSRDIDIVVS